MEQVVLAVVAVISLVLTVQSAHALYLMIYTWDQPEADALARVPAKRAVPRLSFTAIVPARHEEEVIQATINRVACTEYPSELVQVIVVCAADDVGTIERAERAIRRLPNAELVVFDDKPINKPHGLNAALKRARGDVVCIFDAEDEIQQEIFDIVNTIMVTERVKVVQSTLVSV
jgi:cellulose synthase/poly-beta-1,6-N-acetylglucosamine synthase-like glycosyltransferase